MGPQEPRKMGVSKIAHGGQYHLALCQVKSSPKISSGCNKTEVTADLGEGTKLWRSHCRGGNCVNKYRRLLGRPTAWDQIPRYCVPLDALPNFPPL